MSEQNILPDPDCRDGKHAACHGFGWDADQDAPAECPCACHGTDQRTTATPKEEAAAPVEWSVWPPPLASRAIRRSCKPHMVKSGYCALCGTKV
jgi:hypothetical protein